MVIFVIVVLWNRVLNDLRCCGDFLGIYVGKKLSICTRKDTSNLELTMTVIMAIEITAVGIKAVETISV